MQAEEANLIAEGHHAIAVLEPHFEDHLVEVVLQLLLPVCPVHFDLGIRRADQGIGRLNSM